MHKGVVSTSTFVVVLVFLLVRNIYLKMFFLAFPVIFTMWLNSSNGRNNISLEDIKTKRERKLILSNRYSSTKIPSNIDVIIIGSGMSGLTCASTLAIQGKKVLVLEQHTIAGGGTHEFELEGYKFDSGLHYTVPWSGSVMQIACGIDQHPVEFATLGEEDGTFDHVYIGDEPVFKVKHDEKHIKDIYTMFPDNKNDIDEYMNVSERMMKNFPLYAISSFLPAGARKTFAHYFLKTFRSLAGQTAKDVICSVTSNKKLQAVLNSLWIDTGVTPDRVTFMLNACVFRGLPHEGGAYPVGGADLMAKSLITVIEHSGGRVLTNAFVSDLITDKIDGKITATGVVMEDGTEIKAPLVISGIGYENTFTHLVKEEVTTPLKIPKKVGVPASEGFIMCNVGIKGKPEELGITKTNSWYSPLYNGCPFEAIDRYMADPLDVGTEIPIMITFPSVKAHHDNDGVSCQILTMGKYEWFQNYAKEKSGSRSEPYTEIKERYQKNLLELLYRFYPKTKGKVDFVDLSTPLSIEYYLLEPRGGAVGLDQVPDRFVNDEVLDHLNMKTKIQNFYITGQDTLLCGVPLAQAAGLITAFRVLGPMGTMNLLTNALKLQLRKLFC